MNIGAAIFGGFCLILIIAGMFYIVGVSSQQSVYTDTYGNTLTPVANGSQTIVKGTTEGVGLSSMIPLILIAAAIIMCLVIIGFWVLSKSLNL